MMFDTYVDTIQCPECRHAFEAEVHDQSGERLMRTFRPHDLVDGSLDRPRKITEDVRCNNCGHEFPVTVNIFRGIVCHFGEDPPLSDQMQKFMDRAVDANSRRRNHLQHKLDVLRLALRLWTRDPSIEIGDDWHVEDPGLPKLSKGMSADEFIDAIKTYLESTGS